MNINISEILGKIKNNFLLIPEARFDELTKDPGYKDSLVYLAVCMLLSAPVHLAAAVFLSQNPLGRILGLVLALPFGYIYYGVLHLVLKLFGAKEGFLKTVQIFIYGSTGSLILGGIPILGFILSLVALANVVLGSKRVHGISLWRAIAAVVLIPALIVLVIGFLTAALLSPWAQPGIGTGVY